MNDPPNVLYARARASDALQGIADMIEVMELEIQKINRFYPEIHSIGQGYMLNDLFTRIQSLRNVNYQMSQVVALLREKGL